MHICFVFWTNCRVFIGSPGEGDVQARKKEQILWYEWHAAMKHWNYKKLQKRRGTIGGWKLQSNLMRRSARGTTILWKNAQEEQLHTCSTPLVVVAELLHSKPPAIAGSYNYKRLSGRKGRQCLEAWAKSRSKPPLINSGDGAKDGSEVTERALRGKNESEQEVKRGGCRGWGRWTERAACCAIQGSRNGKRLWGRY